MSRRTITESAQRAAVLATACTVILAIGSCGADNAPFERADATAASTAPLPTTPAPAPLPTTAADAPSPAGTTAEAPMTALDDSQARIAADQTAMLDARTMVSIVEGCHSGRESYRDCNTHADLGSPERLGLEIGNARGQVRISATKNGFRVTAFSLSGAKFTVARGPSGDRFKCMPGPDPGACPESRQWSF